MNALIYYWDSEWNAYRFPTLAVAMQYVDEMTDEDSVIIDNKGDSDLLARVQKVFRR